MTREYGREHGSNIFVLEKPLSNANKRGRTVLGCDIPEKRIKEDHSQGII